MSYGYCYSIQDVYDLAAVKSGVNGWVGYHWIAAGDDSVVHGCVPGGSFTRGPRKGKPNFQHKLTTSKSTVVVTEAELQSKAFNYEADTGKCWNCKGDGKAWAGWSVKDGNRTKPCVRCAGSGVTKESKNNG